MKEVLEVAKQCCCIDLKRRPRIDQVAAFLASLQSLSLQEQQHLAAQGELDAGNKEHDLDVEVQQVPNRVFYRGKWVVPRREMEIF